MTRRWRVERIHINHSAYLNNPEEFPVGWWYVTDDPNEEHTRWTETSFPTWDAAMIFIEIEESENAK